MRYPRPVETLTVDLKSRAIDEGFDLVGVAEAAKSRSSGDLERWLDLGMHGEMAAFDSVVQIRENGKVVTMSLKRFQQRRDLVVLSSFLGKELRLVHPKRVADANQPA